MLSPSAGSWLLHPMMQEETRSGGKFSRWGKGEGNWLVPKSTRFSSCLWGLLWCVPCFPPCIKLCRLSGPLFLLPAVGRTAHSKLSQSHIVHTNETKKICIRISNSYFAALARICFHFSGGLSASCTSSTCFREINGYYPPGKQFNGPEAYRKTCWFCSYCVQKGKSLSDACVLLRNLYQNLCMHIVNWILYSRIIPKSVFTVISCAFPSLIKQKLGFV